MIEAEFHAVWRDSAGQLTDVTPRVDGEKNVLFLPDPSQNWDGRQVNNRRRSMRDDPLVHEFIAVHDRIVEVMNAGERAFQFGAVSVPKTEIAPLMMRSAQLLTQLQQLRSGRNDPCPCGSGRKYKRCCAR
ncbi:MAG TPA: SEC-C metal-binding domain-containing protein [Bryobacteraceae bacterium]|nr:SEC-C metal-binding domain-containing protein [Bryobacteraceae bacterium]